MRRALVIALLLGSLIAGVAGCGGGGGAGAAPTSFADRLPDPLPHDRTRPLRERGFVTAVPAGWNERVVRGDGSRSHFLNSGSGEANDFGLAGAGQVGVTIAREQSADSSATVALARIVGTPPNALGVKRTQPVTDARLAGAEAATTQYTYTQGGVTYVQSNLVAVTGGLAIFIEVDAPPAQTDEAERALATVIRNWRWTTPGGGVSS